MALRAGIYTQYLLRSAPRVQDKRRLIALLRQWGPWLIGVGILVVIGLRIPYAAFRGAVGHGPHIALAITDLAIVLAVLCTDSFASWLGLITVRMRRPFSEVSVVRGATYALYVVNYALGQGGFGYYLHRTGASPMRATGATLYLVGTNLATLLVVMTFAWAARLAPIHNAGLWWLLVVGCGSFAAYLCVIAASPSMLATRELLAPLFAANLRGHAFAMLGRLPHACVAIIGPWAAMRVWGIEVPVSVAVMIIPAVTIASVLPISPVGLGTTQAALVYFFSDYAPGVSGDIRAANVLAFSIVHFVYGIAASLVVGFACAPFARRAGAKPAAA